MFISMTDCWLDCHFLRLVNREECIVRLVQTGAILCVSLKAPMEATRACVVSALKPAPARVLLGELHQNKFQGCEVQVEWPAPPTLPDPTRFVRKSLARRKRRRVV
jgi:hypothetical protein